MTIGLSVARGLLRQLPGRFGSTVSSVLSKQHYHTTCASKSLLLTSPKAITLPFARLFHQSTPGLKEVVFKLTDVGEGIAEVEILRWFVKEGDAIKQFDKLCEVQSDKANVEITSRFDGKITKLHHNKGDMAKVGHPLVTLDDDLDNNVAVQSQQQSAPSAAPVHSGKPHSPATGKIIPFKLTDVGEGIAEVEILRWFVKEGDDIKQFDKLCEVQSDKANVEITSRFDGKIRKLHYNKGDMAKVGQPLIDIESDEPASSTGSSYGHSQGSSSSSSSSQSSYAQKQDQSSSKYGKTLASPAVRRLAREFKVDIAKLNATGRDGRVTKGDILNFVSNPSAVLAASESSQPYTSPKINVAASEPKSFPSMQTLVSQTYTAPATLQQPQQPAQITPSPVANLEKDRVIPVRGLMRTMIKTMSESLQIPALGYSDEIIMNDLIKLRLDLKPAAESKGVKITFMPFLIKAVSMAINQYPIMNSSIAKDLSEITIKASHNIGVAMDTPAGLLVPNIKNVQSKSILELAVELNRLQKLGKEGKLSTADLTGGTLTISNIGNIGGTYLRPVILPPEVAIVAFGSIQKLPRYNSKDEVVPHHIMTASWSADHRVIEGATIARFSNVVRDLLENPSKMLLELR